MPWPKGVLPTLPEMQRTEPAQWSADVAAAEELFTRAAARGREAQWPDHAAFGRLSGREWGWLIYKHTDHHLRQFGA